MLTAALCLVALLPQDTQSKLPEAKMGMGQLVLLRPTAKASEMTETEAAELQKGHISFLQGLWEKGTALVLGPIEGEGPISGIVVLDLESKEDAAKVMADDPYVKRGLLNADTQGWYFAKNYVQKAPKFMDLKQYWFGMLERPEGLETLSKEEGEKMSAGHMANITKMAESGALVIAGPMEGKTPLRGIFIFDTIEKAKIDELVKADPLIKNGRLKLTLHKWYAPKGSFLIEK